MVQIKKSRTGVYYHDHVTIDWKVPGIGVVEFKVFGSYEEADPSVGQFEDAFIFDNGTEWDKSKYTDEQNKMIDDYIDKIFSSDPGFGPIGDEFDKKCYDIWEGDCSGIEWWGSEEEEKINAHVKKTRIYLENKRK